MRECNNISACHELLTIYDLDALRVICKRCRHQYFLRKDPIKNVPEKRQYAKVFKKDILQGNDNLFYKYHPQYLTR
jgi:hypothetical protein